MDSKQVMFSLNKQIATVTRKLNEVTYNSIAAVIERIDEVSPVGDVRLWKHPNKAPKGYIGGQFRGNWQLGVDSKPTAYFIGKIDPSGVATVSENIAKIPLAASRHQYFLINNLPYAMALEEGHSTQSPPHAMMYRVKREFNGIVRKVVADIKANGGRVK